MKKIIIASKNPVKINSAKNGFALAFKNEDFEAIGTSASSEISDQPMTSSETLIGAENRVKNAKQAMPDGDYWVGIEGGIEDIENRMIVFAWIVVEDKSGKRGMSKTCEFELPEKVAELIRGGMELGGADDVVFQRENSKQQNGSIGILTNDIITRESYYKEAMVCALIPFIHPELY